MSLCCCVHIAFTSMIVKKLSLSDSVEVKPIYKTAEIILLCHTVLSIFRIEPFTYASS